MESIASELKSQREKQKVSLAQISADTRISVRHLQSLEEGRFDDLPGGIYTRAFLRAYCESLKLDQLEMLQRYESEVSLKSEKPPKHRTQIPPQNPSIKIHPVAIWGLLLIISAGGIFLSRKWIYSVFSPYFADSVAKSPSYVPPQHNQTPPVSGNSVPNPLSVSSVQVPQELPKEPAATSPDLATNAEAEKVAPGGNSSSSVGSPSSPAVSSDALRLEVLGKEACWISISRDGSSVFRGILQPGEHQAFSAEEKLFIIVGNAGGISLKINGKSTKPLGKSGEVIKLLIDQTTLSDLIDRSAG